MVHDQRPSAYVTLAPIYDKIMSHVRYDDWVGLIKRVIQEYAAVADPMVLEIGGGTGMLGAKLGRAFRYIGSDLSMSMCRQARPRCNRFLCANGLDLPLKTSFDLVLFLYDGINYLARLSDYRRLFLEIHKRLRHGGLFLFDITTRINSLTHFDEFVDFEDFDTYYYIRHSYYDKVDRTQHNEFTIFRRVQGNPAYFDKSHEHHIQWVFDAEEVFRAVPEDLFDVVGMWDGFSLKKYSSRSERIHFLLRKKE